MARKTARLTFAVAAAALALSAAAAAQDLQVTGGCRDGKPHGAYELRTPDGQLRVSGAFNLGKRTSSFLFWNSDGVRIAHIPYDDDAKSGTLVLWWSTRVRSGEPRRKLEAVYSAGVLNGTKRSFHNDGRLRAEFVYRKGTLVSARAFVLSGRALPENEARALAVQDLEADERFFATLEGLVGSHLPACAAPATAAPASK